jgi:hypothetical protein
MDLLAPRNRHRISLETIYQQSSQSQKLVDAENTCMSPLSSSIPVAGEIMSKIDTLTKANILQATILT